MRRERSPWIRWGGVLAGLLLLASCLPAVPGEGLARYDVAIVGAPSSGPVPGAALGLVEALVERGYGGSILPSDVSRFLEARAGMVGARVPQAAARLGRSMGAETIVVVDAARLDREWMEGPGGAWLRVALQLRVRVVDPVTGSVLAERLDRVRVAERPYDGNALPALRDDVVLAGLSRAAVGALTPWLHGILEPSTQTF